jgi:hypothetical protein
MNHGRLELEPRLVHVLKPLAPVAIIVAFLAVVSLGRSGRSVGPADVLVPVAIVAFLGSLEFTWFLARAARSVAFDEEGITLLSRQGEETRLPWSDLADRDSRIFAPGWVLVGKDGRRRTLSTFGLTTVQRSQADRRIVDVLLHGPPLAREEKDWKGRIPAETTASLLAGLGSASLGALLGAAGWGLLAWLTGLEIGYAAIGVGALVGLFARSAGGRGPALGAGCAVLVLASILTGKILAARLYVGDYVRTEQARFDRAMYDRISKAAAEIAGGTPENRYARLLVELGWTEASDASQVGKEEIAAFRENDIPNLRRWNNLPPRFEAWQEERRESVRENILANVSYRKVLTSSIGALDLLFAAIGISTALRISGEKRKPGNERSGIIGPEAPRMAGSRVAGKKVVFPPKKKGEEATPGPPPAAPPPPGSDPPAPRS